MLTWAELWLARKIVREREFKNMSNPEIKDQTRDPVVLKDIHRKIEAYCGELAFGRIHNLYPAIDWDGPDNGKDFVLEGHFIDVKHTQHGRLLLVADNCPRPSHGCDLYALVTGEVARDSKGTMLPSRLTYHGMMTAFDLLEPARLKPQKVGHAYQADKDELKSWMEMTS